jgi:hypothetical protein
MCGPEIALIKGKWLLVDLQERPLPLINATASGTHWAGSAESVT